MRWRTRGLAGAVHISPTPYQLREPRGRQPLYKDETCDVTAQITVFFIEADLTISVCVYGQTLKTYHAQNILYDKYD